MNQTKINITFDHFTLREPVISGIIRRCILAVLDAQRVLGTLF